MTGEIKDFRVYTTALNDTQVAALSAQLGQY